MLLYHLWPLRLYHIFTISHKQHDFGEKRKVERKMCFNPLNTELNPICHLLVLLGAHLILHVSRIRVNFLYSLC
jgi:hypothetical protein